MKNSQLIKLLIKRLLLKTIVLLVTLAQPLLIKAQIRIDWQQCYGSLEDDWGLSIVQSDNGFTILGQAETNYPSGLFGCNGYAYRLNWLIGIDETQSIEWQNCDSIGIYQKLHKTGDGHYYYITELGGDYYNRFNMKVRKMDREGNLLWSRYLGTNYGLGFCAEDVFGLPTSDGGIIAATVIGEASGNVSQYFGGNDCWIVKLDAEGNLVWQTTLGTGGNENVTCLQSATDGGFFVWVDSEVSGYGNIGCGQQGNKGILVKLDTSGQPQWNLCFSRTSVYSMVELENGYLFAGDYRYTTDPYGNCGDGIHTYDCYLMRCDVDGNVLWEKEYGGSCNDRMVKVFQNDNGGFTIFTNSKSMDGDVKSATDLGIVGIDKGNIWIFNVDSEGTLLWERCIGSSLGLWEELRDVIRQSDKEYALVGFNTWFDGVSSGFVSCSNNELLPNSRFNVWFLGVTDIFDYDDIPEKAQLQKERINIIPNPTTDQFTVIGNNLRKAEILNLFGQHVLISAGEGDRITVNLRGLPAGIYFVTVTDDEGRKCVQKVVKE